jgi:hypothetical protein
VNQLSPDLLIYVLVILGILLFNYLARQGARRRQDEPAGGEPPAQEEPLEQIFGRARRALPGDPLRAQPPVPARVDEVRSVVAEVPRRRSIARPLLKGRQNLQRAFIVMTVLGPCRALEPPGAAPGGAGAGTSPGRAAQ